MWFIALRCRRLLSMSSSFFKYDFKINSTKVFNVIEPNQLWQILQLFLLARCGFLQKKILNKKGTFLTFTKQVALFIFSCKNSTRMFCCAADELKLGWFPLIFVNFILIHSSISWWQINMFVTSNSCWWNLSIFFLSLPYFLWINHVHECGNGPRNKYKQLSHVRRK